MEIKPNELMSKGVDVSDYYLKKEDQFKFKLFRYKERIWAIKNPLGTPEPALMWCNATDNENYQIDNKKEVMEGTQARVYSTSNDPKTLCKILKSDSPPSYDLQKINLILLEQKFQLIENNISKFFLFGLWNLSDKENAKFLMPKIEGQNIHLGIQKEDLIEIEEKVCEFVSALYVLNIHLGYSHPDYARTVYHESFNLMETERKIVLIDMDRGFSEIDLKFTGSNFYDGGKDQWLLACNMRNKKLQEWYSDHPNEYLSDNLSDLLYLARTKKIYIPKQLLNKIKDTSYNNGSRMSNTSELSSFSYLSNITRENSMGEFWLHNVLEKNEERIDDFKPDEIQDNSLEIIHKLASIKRSYSLFGDLKKKNENIINDDSMFNLSL